MKDKDLLIKLEKERYKQLKEAIDRWMKARRKLSAYEIAEKIDRDLLTEMEKQKRNF